MMIFVLVSFLVNNVVISQADFEEFLSLSIGSERIDIGIISPLNSPIEIPGAIKGTIQANTEWVFTCSAERDFLSREGNTVPVDRLSWRIEGSEWVPFEMGEVKLMEGVPTSDEGRSFSIDLRLDLKWVDNAGDFLTNIGFTLMKK